jgi:hypothetical protein
VATPIRPKDGDAVLVRWQDALTTAAGWKPIDDIATEPADVVTVGVLIEQNDKAIVVALTVSDDEVNSAIAIPVGWVQHISVLQQAVL